jgi:hypothetical protein
MKRLLCILFAIAWTLATGRIFSVEIPVQEPTKHLKVLHLSFHKGCIQEFEGIGKLLDLNVESWFIPDLPGKFFDGVSSGNVLYNITHERADNIWNKHKRLFENFDAILVSDTAPLSRVFIQNGWKKPLIVWVCNRFDYYDHASLDGEFPDPEYYDFFRTALMQKNVFVIPYTSFERRYAQEKGVNITNFVIAPCYPRIMESSHSSIPSTVVKKECFFLPPYHNETKFMDFSTLCTQLGVKNYCGRYNGPSDLKDFKGIIHLPYNWSNLAFFENSRFGIPYFVPSKHFLEELLTKGKYFHADARFLSKERLFELSEWYSPEHKDVITYFDSWGDLKAKIEATDFVQLRRKVKQYAFDHFKRMLDRWSIIFHRIRKMPVFSSERTPHTHPPFVVGRLSGQLGNQFFMVAATVSLSLKNNAVPLFPDFSMQKDQSTNLKENYEKVFSRLDASPPSEEVEYYYREPEFPFHPITYHDNMEMRGWFQSEEYFREHKKEILDLFSPSEEIVNYLRSKYADIIDHPFAVAVHVRSYLMEDPDQKVYVNLGMDYYKAAMVLFPEEALFVVFSPQMKWCKENFSSLGKNVRFVEGEKHYHDLYLMSMCKHNIICNSTFSWWGAYLNQNPDKKVIAPSKWFCPSYNHDTRDLLPKEWIVK